jgi:serine/threonine protein kinase
VASAAAIKGISLTMHAVNTFGQSYCQTFSKHVKVANINVICLLGQGSYAKVYLVDTRSAICCQ